MNSQGLLLIAVTAGVMLLAIYLTSNIIDSDNGGISAAVRTIGIGLAIWAFVRPKAGLYIVTVEAFSLDFIKKIAVFYGTASMGTIIEVLIVGMLAVVATVAGVLLQSVAFRRFKISPIQWVVLALATLAAVGMLFAAKSYLGFEKAAENAFNCCVYIALALPMCIFLPSREEVTKLLNLQFFLATIWAVWGIKQYYAGFTLLEWFYAETGLSAVASEHMLRFEVPRPFGFGTGVANYSVLPAYFCYGLWHLFSHRRRRILFLVCTAVVFWGVITSLQRTPLIFPIFALAFYYAFQTLRRAMITYATCVTVFVLGILNAEYIYYHLADINELISLKGFWGENMLTVSTYSERLVSWMLLKDPTTWSLFGTRDNLAVHDVITGVVVSYGIVGLLCLIVTLSGGAWFVHRTIVRVADTQDRKFAIFCLSIVAAGMSLSFAGGANFGANPVNLEIWTFLGAVLCMVVNSRLADAPVKTSMREIMQMLEDTPPRVPMAARAALIQQEA